MDEEITLDTAIELFRLVWDYEEYEKGLREVLTRCHTQEELDKARAVIDEEKERLMETNPEFKEIMDRRKAEVKRRADEDKALHRARMAEASAEASRARTEAMSKVKGLTDVEDFVARSRFKVFSPEEAEKKLSKTLICPICKDKDHGNIVNQKKTCMKCMHTLVEETELKNYPRKYRRNWLKKRRKKG